MGLANLRNQRGQALVYLALVLAAMVTATYVTYDASRLVYAKIQAQNAADAAALAAASLKASVHDTRTLAYLAMTYEATLARLEIYQAMASYQDPGAMAVHLQHANTYLDRFHRLRLGLQGFDAWVQQDGPSLVTQAAHVAWAANIRGLNDPVGPGAAANQQAEAMFLSPSSLRENAGSSGTALVGGIDYRGEGTGGSGASGKTYVTATPQFVPLASGLVAYPALRFPLPVRAAAGPAESGAIASYDSREQPLGLPGKLAGALELPWYKARLYPVGDDPSDDAHYHPLH